MKILTRDETIKAEKLFNNENFLPDICDIIDNGQYKNQDTKSNVKRFLISSFKWESQEEFSNADLTHYGDVKRNKTLLNKYKKEENKHLSFYKSLFCESGTYVLIEHEFVFLNFESFEELQNTCKIITRDELHMMLVFPEKKLVTRYDWDLRIQVFYYEETGYNFATNLAKELGFYVFE